MHSMSLIYISHNWQSGARRNFLTGMYSLFAGALARKTFVACEHRGGITGLACAAAPAIWMPRTAMVDDRIEPDALRPPRFMPQAWLKPGATTRFANMATEFGPVTLDTRVARGGRTLHVGFKPAFRRGAGPRRIVPHTPPLPKGRRVVFNGRAVARSARGVCVRQS